MRNIAQKMIKKKILTYFSWPQCCPWQQGKEYFVFFTTYLLGSHSSKAFKNIYLEKEIWRADEKFVENQCKRTVAVKYVFFLFDCLNVWLHIVISWGFCWVRIFNKANRGHIIFLFWSLRWRNHSFFEAPITRHSFKKCCKEFF